MRNNKNILIVIPTLTYGWWAEKSAIAVWDYLSKKYNIRYFTFHKDDIKYEHEGEYFTLWQKNTASFLKILTIPLNVILLYRFCRKNNIDTIISHMERANIISIIAHLFLKNVSQISVVHSYKYSLERTYKPLIRLLYKYSDRVVCVSKTIEKMLIQNFKIINTTTIYNAINIDEVQKCKRKKLDSQGEKIFSNARYTYITVWKLRDAKWHLRLLDSFCCLYAKDKNTQLVIIWEWPYRAVLEKRIRELGLWKSVYLVWSKKNIYPYLGAADCFVFSSLWEWFWIVLIEALATWLPVISTDCLAGPREILAPELELQEQIKYPYKWKYWYLENSINFSLESFSRSMWNIKNKTVVFSENGAERFWKNILFEKWDSVVW